MALYLPRREFLKASMLGMGGLLLSQSPFAFAENSSGKQIKIGIIGCGGRGMGAATDSLDADPNVIIWAMADIFQEQIDKGIELIEKDYTPTRISVPKERQFTGLDAYQKLLATDIDIVLLTCPPVFRPLHIKAAVEAGKTLFAEKPVAVDVPGVLSVLESAKLAKEKNLLAYNGFCWRFDAGCRAAFDELHTKQSFGKPLAFNGTYFVSPPKTSMSDTSRPQNITDVEWAIKNWVRWNWLSGGSFVEQIIHTVDLMTWTFGEIMPIAAIGSGGRTQLKEQGDVWDHYQIQYELPDKKYGNISSRQWSNCFADVSDKIFCEKGILHTPYRPRFEGEKRWRFSGEKNNMFKQTHVELIADFKAGKAYEALESAAYKTLAAIMGRTAAQTGQRVTWEEILKDTTTLMPENLTLDTSLPPAEVAVPGLKSTTP